MQAAQWARFNRLDRIAFCSSTSFVSPHCKQRTMTTSMARPPFVKCCFSSVLTISYICSCLPLSIHQKFVIGSHHESEHVDYRLEPRVRAAPMGDVFDPVKHPLLGMYVHDAHPSPVLSQDFGVGGKTSRMESEQRQRPRIPRCDELRRGARA